MLGNGLVFAAYYYSPSLRKPVHTIMMSLAATDFLCGATTQPLYIWDKTLMTGICTRTICKLTEFERFFMLFLIGETVLNLSVTTLDRYIAVCHSYRYPELVTNGRLKILLGLIWGVWFIIAALATVFGIVESFFAIILIVNVVFIIVTYIKVWREVRRLEKNAVVPISLQNNQEEQRKEVDRKGAKTVGFILGSLFVSFVPMILYGIFTIAKVRFFKGILLMYASTAAFANSSFNVFIYYWRNEEMRRAMTKAIKKLTGRDQTN